MTDNVKFDIMVADLIVQEASTNYTFIIPLEDGCVTKNLRRSSSIQYNVSKKIGMIDASRVQGEKVYVPLQEMV